MNAKPAMRSRGWMLWNIAITSFVQTISAQSENSPKPALTPEKSVAGSPSANLGSERGILRGKVVDEGGAPIANAYVVLDETNMVKTADDGRFIMENAPQSGRYRIACGLEFFPIKDKALVTRELEQVVTVHREIRCHGKVLDADTHRPIHDFSVVPSGVYGSSGREQWLWDERQSGGDGKYDVIFGARPFFMPVGGRLMVEAEGYEPGLSNEFTFEDGEKTLDFALRKGEPIKGRALLPGGGPAALADVYLWAGELNLKDVPVERRIVTGDNGDFSLKPAWVQSLIIKHADGHAEIAWEHFRAMPEVRLQAKGRIIGTYRQGERPVPNVRVSSMPIHYRDDPFFPTQAKSSSVKTDVAGHFSLEVPAGEYWLAVQRSRRQDMPGGTWMMPVEFSHGVPVVVRSGAVTEMNLGGSGRRITGQGVVPEESKEISWTNCYGALKLKLPEVPGLPGLERHDYPPGAEYPADQRTMSYWRSPEGRTRQRATRIYIAAFEQEGGFQFYDVPPGVYRLSLSISVPGRETLDRRDPQSWKSYTLEREIVVPASTGLAEDDPIDLGIVEIQQMKR